MNKGFDTNRNLHPITQESIRETYKKEDRNVSKRFLKKVTKFRYESKLTSDLIIQESYPEPIKKKNETLVNISQSQ